MPENTHPKIPIAHEWNKKYLRYFSYSLKRFPERYVHLVFGETPVHDDYLVYLCPICLKNCMAVEKGTIYASEEFSEDHFPPESAGGKLTVLVCKPCNNTAGNSYESSLQKKLERVSFDKRVPGSAIKTKVVIDSVKGWRHGVMGVADDKQTYFQLTVTKNERLPALTSEQEATNNNGQGWKTNISPYPTEHALVSRALLKAAYLYCFFNWGYDFVFSANGAVMRKAFLGDAPYPIEVGEFWFDDETPIASGHTIPRGLCFIQEPEVARSIVVNLPLRLKANGYACVVPVLIPDPTANGIENLHAVQALLKNNPGITINVFQVNNAILHCVTDCYQRTWDDLVKGPESADQFFSNE